MTCSLPPTVTVDAGPFRPGVKPATTPGVLSSAGAGACGGALSAGGRGGAVAGALLSGAAAGGGGGCGAGGASFGGSGGTLIPVIAETAGAAGGAPVDRDPELGAGLPLSDTIPAIPGTVDAFEGALYAPAVGPEAAPGMTPPEPDIMTGLGPMGIVFAEFTAASGALALDGGAAAGESGALADGEDELAPEPGEPFAVKGTHAKFVLLLDWTTTLLPPRNAGASRIVER